MKYAVAMSERMADIITQKLNRKSQAGEIKKYATPNNKPLALRARIIGGNGNFI